MGTIISLVQGQSVSSLLSIDMSEAGVLDIFQVEIAQNGTTVLKYRSPTTTGYSSMTKTDDTYSISVTTAQTSLMKGLYEVEITGFVGVEEPVKGTLPITIQVNEQKS